MPSKTVNKLKNPIPEDFELSDDEPTTVNFNKEQTLTSKYITFDCPLCCGKLQLRNEIEINPKGITCRCNPCSFKLTKNDKTMNVSKDDDGGITLDSSDHSIQFSFNRITTPPTEDEANRNKMISDVMNKAHQSPIGSKDPNTPRNESKQNSLNDME